VSDDASQVDCDMCLALALYQIDRVTRALEAALAEVNPQSQACDCDDGWKLFPPV
jgi:K+-transporting ATPase c subunit